MIRRTAAAALGLLLVLAGPGVSALAQEPTEEDRDLAALSVVRAPDAAEDSTIEPSEEPNDTAAAHEAEESLLGTDTGTGMTAPQGPNPGPSAAPPTEMAHLSRTAPLGAMAAVPPASGVCMPLTDTEMFRLLPMPDRYSRTDLHIDTIAKGVLGNDAFEHNMFTYRGEELARHSGIRIELVSGPAHALSFSIEADGRFSYLPMSGYYGADRFEYRLRYTPFASSESFWCSEPVTVTIEDDGHLPQDDSYSVQKDAVLDTNTVVVVCSGFYCGVLRNDRNLPKYPAPLATVASATAGGVTRTVAEFAGGSELRLTRGTLQSLRENGHFRYVPDAGASGTDGFTYTIAGSNRTAAVSITVEGSQPPGPVGTPVGEILQGVEGETLTIAPSRLLKNDPGAQYITHVNGGQPFLLRTHHGTLELEWRSVQENQWYIPALWDLKYTPDPIPGTTGSLDSFFYWVRGSPEPAFVGIAIKNVQRPPVGHDDTAKVYQGQTLTLDVIANDTDPDGDIDRSTARLAPCSETCPGTWSMADGVLSYQPDPSFSGTVTRKYTVQDRVDEGDEGEIGSTEATIRVTVLPAPAVDDRFETDEDTVLTGDVAANDAREAFAGIEGARVEVTDRPTHGELTLSGDQGAFGYMPEPNFFGTDSFRYRWVDGATGKLLSEAAVSVTVHSVNDPPKLSVLDFCLEEDECPDGEVRDVTVGQPVTVSGSLSDPDGDRGVLTIDWHDGTVSDYPYACDAHGCAVEGASSPGGAANGFSATHVYTSVGSDPLRPIQISAADMHGASVKVSTAARVLSVPDPVGPIDPVDQTGPVDPVNPDKLPTQQGPGGPSPTSLVKQTAEGTLARTGDSRTGGAVAALVSLSALAILFGAALWCRSTRRQRV